MVKVENECVGCHTELGCTDYCAKKQVRYLYCDECNSDVDKLYKLDGTEFCEDCLHEYVLEHYVEEVIE